jgi:outer membrane protein assembly factor BamB
MTVEGTLHSFGAEQTEPMKPDTPSSELALSEEVRQQARSLLTQAGNREGYALLLGLEDGNLASALVAESHFHLVAIDSDPERVRLFRDRMVAAGLYGERASAIVADPMTSQLPAYMAHAIFSENLERAGLGQGRAFVEIAFHSLRPYGGSAVFHLADEEQKKEFQQAYQAASLEKPDIVYQEDRVILSRPGALPDTDNWTNQYGDPSNSVVSSDSRVKAPLGLLWFGGPSNQGVLPRHGHGPTQQVVDGRLFIEGPDMIRAVDVYTGRLLWETSLPGVGAIYDNTAHQPGANSVGSNYVSTSDTIYVAYGDVGVCLDPVDGSVKNQFTIPASGDPSRHDHWGFLNADEDVLLVATSPLNFDSDVYFVEDEFRKLEEEQWKEMAQWVSRAAGVNLDENDEEEIIEAFNKLLNTPDLLNNLPDNPAALAATEQVRDQIKKHLATRTASSSEDIVLAKLNRELIVPFVPEIRARTIAVGDWIFSGVSSQRLVALDRRSGEMLWSKDANNAFVHNTVILGGGKAFAIDRLPLSEVQHLQRRGKSPEKEFRIVAWDAKTGEELWSTNEGIFGTWLSYSAEHDLLLQAGRASRDMLPEPDDQLTVYDAADGSVKWHKEIEYGGPCMLHGDTLITQGFALDLLTGEPKMRAHPLTGEQVPWTFERNYGCNSAVASEHLLTFRSAAAGFFDLARDGGTGNIGGFRSGCTTNLIVADGVLNAPDYTRTCICAYQLQTSLALVHMPELEMWTFNPMDKAEVPIRQVGLNFGAPGDRMADDGLLWLDYPSVGGPSPDVPVTVKDEGVKWFRRNALELGDEGQGQGWKWVASSGAEGLDEINVRLASGWTKERKYTVRLHFADFDSTAAGERVFDVELQGKKVLEDLDIVGEVGPKAPLVKEFKGVEIGNDLSLKLTKNTPEGGREPLLSGLEIRAEEE